MKKNNSLTNIWLKYRNAKIDKTNNTQHAIEVYKKHEGQKNNVLRAYEFMLKLKKGLK